MSGFITMQAKIERCGAATLGVKASQSMPAVRQVAHLEVNMLCGKIRTHAHDKVSSVAGQQTVPWGEWALPWQTKAVPGWQRYSCMPPPVCPEPPSIAPSKPGLQPDVSGFCSETHIHIHLGCDMQRAPKTKFDCYRQNGVCEDHTES